VSETWREGKREGRKGRGRSGKKENIETTEGSTQDTSALFAPSLPLPIATLGEGIMEYVDITRSGYSSRILEISRVPIPAPVPPPMEWVS